LQDNGIPAADIPGQKGQFDVLRDGELVFSKQNAGHFPEHGEILAVLRA
jgi:predicted Rdx family selenoprotein